MPEEKKDEIDWDVVMEPKEEMEYLIHTYQSDIEKNNKSIARKEQEIEKLEKNNVILLRKLTSFSKLLKHLS